MHDRFNEKFHTFVKSIEGIHLIVIVVNLESVNSLGEIIGQTVKLFLTGPGQNFMKKKKMVRLYIL